ncbi:MAG: acylneuraminate cytidylyltransferase [Deltaproteobacteria bacterium]|nr:acylneuraminate cytidylyltransferase [Deltaproteobacteria bacterium]
MNFGVIIAARAASQRLPGKALLPLLGIEVLRLVIRRVKASCLSSSFILATTENTEDDALEEIASEEGIFVFRGSVDDVLGRFSAAAATFFGPEIDYIVRITADCPFVGGETLDPILRQCRELVSFDLTTTKPRYPHGIDYEIYARRLLGEIDKKPEITAEEREHILNYVYNREAKFRVVRLTPPENLRAPDVQFLLDTRDDYATMRNLLRGIDDIYVSAEELVKRSRNEN